MHAHTHMHTALGPLAVSGHIFDCYTLGGATGIYWVEARVASQHLTVHRAAPTQQVFVQPEMCRVLRLGNPKLD